MEKLTKYNTPLGTFDKVLIKEEKSLRIVLTGRCNLACEFCIYKKENFNSSEVETDELLEMNSSDELIKTCLYMKNNFGYDIIHLTGGEPTLCKDMFQICSGLVANGFKINIVTNLINIDVIEKLYENGLVNELTFSYVPEDRIGVNRKESLNNYKTDNIDRYKLVLKNALMLKKRYNAKIKANIICSGLTNIEDAVNMIKWCFKNEISPRLQRDRSNDRIKESNETVEIILSCLKMKKEAVEIRVPGATEILKYYNDENHKINVKVFNKNFRFSEICKNCINEVICDKALSSIRIYKKSSGVHLCFCNKIDDEFTTMKLERLKKNTLINELFSYKNDRQVYFDKFCTKPNHQ